jgi:hypothetical protein
MIRYLPAVFIGPTSAIRHLGQLTPTVTKRTVSAPDAGCAPAPGTCHRAECESSAVTNKNSIRQSKWKSGRDAMGPPRESSRSAATGGHLSTGSPSRRAVRWEGRAALLRRPRDAQVALYLQSICHGFTLIAIKGRPQSPRDINSRPAPRKATVAPRSQGAGHACLSNC